MEGGCPGCGKEIIDRYLVQVSLLLTRPLSVPFLLRISANFFRRKVFGTLLKAIKSIVCFCLAQFHLNQTEEMVLVDPYGRVTGIILAS